MIRKYESRDEEKVLDIWSKSSSLAHPFLDIAFVKKIKSDMEKIYLPNAETWVYEENNEVIYEADPKLRDFENVPLKESIDDYFNREVVPHVSDAWVDESKTKVGYAINFNRHFYRFTELRSLAEIDEDINAAEEEIIRLLNEVAII